jgi:putative ABC transport system permease protein
MWDALRVDIRHSLRGLRRSPGFTVVVILTIALTMGAITTIGSLLNAIVLRTVSVTEPNRLVSISATDIRTNQLGSLYADAFAAYRAAQHSLSSMCMYTPGLLRVEARNATADGVSEGVTPEYFDLLGVRAAAGRFFTDADGAGELVAVISDRFRRRVFGNDAAANDVIGETVKMDGRPVTIIGVTAAGFDGLQFDSGTDLFLPIGAARSLAGDTQPLRTRYIVGRLKPGVTMAQARAELRARWPAILEVTLPSSLSSAEQQALRSQRIDAESLASGISGLRLQYGSSLAVLAVLAGFLAAITCVNLAGLLLVRSLARRHQIAVRQALGASCGRIVQQTLIDGVLLALGGLLASLPFPWWTIRGFAATASIARATPLLQNLTPDARVLGSATLFTLVIGVVIGILPAWQAVRARTADRLRPGRAIAGTLGRSGRLLLVAQVALSTVLLVGAGLFAGTLLRLRANDGSLHNRIVWTPLSPTPGDRDPMSGTYLRALLQRLEGLQGVDAAALSVYFPAYLGFPGQLRMERYSRADAGTSAEVAGLTEFVSPGFFSMFGIPRLRGRDFTWTDDGRALPVVLINEGLAHRLFTGDEAIGQRLRAWSGRTTKEFQIIGVVADAAIGTIREPHQPVVFRPILQEPARARFALAHMRVTGDLKTVRDASVRAIASQGRHFVRAVFTMEEWVDHALLQERLTAALSMFAGGMTLALACIGVYGLLAYAVTSRIREIGVRLALGATHAQVVRMIVREGLAIAVPGVAIGIPCALVAARLVRSQLYGVVPNDPSTITGAAVVLVLTSVVASLLPALRASKIDPSEALRQE